MLFNPKLLKEWKVTMYYLGGKSAFSVYHPAVNLIYIAFVLIITMITLNPYIIGTSWLVSAIVWFVTNKENKFIINIITGLPIIIFTVVIQPIFSNTGTTVLFYINDKAVTLEAYIYGAVMGVLFVTVIQWIGCCRVFIDSEKLYYLFGRIAPLLGLTFSMILRFIPLLRSRYREIHDAQIAMGRHRLSAKKLDQVRQYLKEISILISWSLENSIETSKSMESRGFGLKGRTTYHLYHLKKTEIGLIAVLFTALCASFCIIITGKVSVYYMPAVVFPPNKIWTWGICFMLFIIGLFPVWCELLAKYKLNKNFLQE